MQLTTRTASDRYGNRSVWLSSCAGRYAVDKRLDDIEVPLTRNLKSNFVSLDPNAKYKSILPLVAGQPSLSPGAFDLNDVSVAHWR